MNKIKAGKAPGVCGIYPEYIQHGSSDARTLHKIVTQVWKEEVVPEELHQGIIIPLYKEKGSKSKCSNYRGITLLSVPGKVFAHIILARIKPTLLSHCVLNFLAPLTTTLLVVFGQVGLTAHGLKSRLVFARAVCWPQTHLPQTWIGCWTGLLNLARLVWRLAKALSLIWILLTMSLKAGTRGVFWVLKHPRNYLQFFLVSQLCLFVQQNIFWLRLLNIGVCRHDKNSPF